ncbi:MAG: hypothetical protein AAB724_02140 [Patescibacteria group bacterium]
MPIILRCQCGKETAHVYPANQGWKVNPQIGGTEVLCPDCRQKKAIATTANNDDLMRIVNSSDKQPIDFAECGEKLLLFFRKEQRKHGRKECLCAECQDDMVNALKELAGQKVISDSERPSVKIITRPITPISTLRPPGSPSEKPEGNDAA